MAPGAPIKRKRLEDIQRELERPFDYENRLAEARAAQVA